MPVGSASDSTFACTAILMVRAAPPPAAARPAQSARRSPRAQHTMRPARGCAPLRRTAASASVRKRARWRRPRPRPREVETKMSEIQSVLRECRVFQPPADFAARSHYKGLEDYERAYRRSIDATDEFWADMASHLHWFK